MKYLLILSLLLTGCASSFVKDCEKDNGKMVYAGNQRYCLLPTPVEKPKGLCYSKMFNFCAKEPKRLADKLGSGLTNIQRIDLEATLYGHCLEFAEEFSKDCPEEKK